MLVSLKAAGQVSVAVSSASIYLALTRQPDCSKVGRPRKTISHILGSETLDLGFEDCMNY